MAEIERKTKRYLTDLTDEEWAMVEPVMPKLARTGRQREVDLREVVNAIRYLARAGCGWRMLLKDFPPWQTVYWWFRRFVRLLLFQTIHDVALMLDRERVGREASPTGAGCSTASRSRHRPPGNAALTVARKSWGASDTDGCLLMINLMTADISDCAGARMILDAIRKRWPWRKHLFADGAYDRGQLLDKAAFLDFVIKIVIKIVGKIVGKMEGQKGFQVLPRRWIVERTFGWMMRWRRLVRDYEQRIDVSEAIIQVAMGSLPLRRIAH